MRTPPDHDLIFHDGQENQYTSRAFQKALERPGITQSISRPGNLHDNAVVEFFFKTLKRELIKRQAYEDQEETKQDIFKYIEFYYNTKRMHSTLGYMSPRDFERQSA